MRHIDADLDPHTPTMFELVPSSIGALNVIGRGLSADRAIGRNPAFVLRTASTHFSGQVNAWLDIDRWIAAKVEAKIAERDPDFVFAALPGVDKTSHSEGHTGAFVDRALVTVNDLVGTIRHQAEAKGTWERTHVWVVSDHGHSPVSRHDDLAGLIGRIGFKTIAHPFVFLPGARAAVMVSGNAMAHLYLDLPRRTRPWLRDLGNEWQPVRDAILSRESVDLMILPVSPHSCEIHSLSKGFAVLTWRADTFSYTPATGDPLGIGSCQDIGDRDAYNATIETDYPDAIVQIARLAASPRSGDIILSATRGWDFRAKYEPIPHLSSHGALHRDHMLVPLLMNHPPASRPRRTVDVMPSALDALGIPIPSGLDGRSFLS